MRFDATPFSEIMYSRQGNASLLLLSYSKILIPDDIIDKRKEEIVRMANKNNTINPVLPGYCLDLDMRNGRGGGHSEFAIDELFSWLQLVT